MIESILERIAKSLESIENEFKAQNMDRIENLLLDIQSNQG